MPGLLANNTNKSTKTSGKRLIERSMKEDLAMVQSGRGEAPSTVPKNSSQAKSLRNLTLMKQHKKAKKPKPSQEEVAESTFGDSEPEEIEEEEEEGEEGEQQEEEEEDVIEIDAPINLALDKGLHDKSERMERSDDEDDQPLTQSSKLPTFHSVSF